MNIIIEIILDSESSSKSQYKMHLKYLHVAKSKQKVQEPEYTKRNDGGCEKYVKYRKVQKEILNLISVKVDNKVQSRLLCWNSNYIFLIYFSAGCCM